MNLAALFILGGCEVIVIPAVVLMLLGTKQKANDARPSHPALMPLTLMLGAAFLILVVYGFSK
jgi:hypothetical protein